MLQYNVKIGLAPMRRDVTPRPGIFNWEKAEERGHRMVAYIREHFTDDKVSFVDLEGINPVDVMYCDEDAQKVIDRFNAEKVDAVLIINCNFGNEEIAAQVARGVGKPVCIWAPIDDSFLPDGTRYTIAIFIKNSAENPETNARIIADISETVYRYVRDEYREDDIRPGKKTHR